MTKILNGAGRNRDRIQIAPIVLPAVAAGSANDYEWDLLAIPAHAPLYPTGFGAAAALDAITLYTLNLIASAGVTGSNVHNFTFNIMQRRAGALLVNTTAPTTIVAGSNVVVTPASMANIAVGSFLVFSGGTGTTETVVVSAVTATTFTATFAYGHSGAYTITSAPLLTYTFSSGNNLTAHVPLQLVPQVLNNVLLPGDVLTIQRVSNDATGLAQPILTLQPEWRLAGILE